MQPLESLQQEYPFIDASFLEFCASYDIFSVEDFLVHDLYVLAASAERCAAAEELKQGIIQVLSILDNLHLPWVNGVQFLEDAEENKHILPSGCRGIDALLQGGLREGQLTELVGPSSSGKTQVCLHAASNVALNCNGAVIFFDTCNSFSSKRIADIVSYHLSSSFKEVNKNALSGVMSNILCHSVFDIYTLLDGLQQLELKLGAQVKNEYMRTRLLIVDSISSLIAPVLGGGGPHGHSLMVSVGSLLKKLANEHNLSVLLTNHTVSGGGGMTKPALGESWKTVPHVRLLLSRDHESNFYNVSLLKHTCMASGQVGRFVI